LHCWEGRRIGISTLELALMTMTVLWSSFWELGVLSEEMQEEEEEEAWATLELESASAQIELPLLLHLPLVLALQHFHLFAPHRL
jgi:hypothetical protein